METEKEIVQTGKPAVCCMPSLHALVEGAAHEDCSKKAIIVNRPLPFVVGLRVPRGVRSLNHGLRGSPSLSILAMPSLSWAFAPEPPLPRDP